MFSHNDSYPFASAADASASTTTTAFDPSAFMIPGSPIGAFSPLSESDAGAGGDATAPNRFFGSLSVSPVSFPDLELDLDQTLDPTSLFGSPPLNAVPEVEEQEHQQVVAASTTTATSTSVPVQLANIQLPPLPVVTEERREAEDVLIVSAPAAPRSRRAVSSAFGSEMGEEFEGAEDGEEEQDDQADEDDDDDDEAYSDGSSHKRHRSSKGGKAAATTGSKAKRPATKKAKNAVASPSVATSSSSSHSPSAPNTSSRQPKTSVSAFATKELHHTSARSTLAPVPEWTDKPDPETYKKLDSKQKRQLRNKISARNFRHRRKEQQTKLEEEISTRDAIIAQLRDEVGVVRGENEGLRKEVGLLRIKWEEMMSKMTQFAQVPSATGAAASAGLGLGVDVAKAVTIKRESSDLAATATNSAMSIDDNDSLWALDSPRATASPATMPVPLPLASPALPPSTSTTSTRRAVTRASNGIAKPNLNKDIAAPSSLSSLLSSRAAGSNSSSSWAQQSQFGNGYGFGGAGGYMSVHTT